MQSEANRSSLTFFFSFSSVYGQLQNQGSITDCKSKCNSPIHKQNTDFRVRQWNQTELFQWVLKIPVTSSLLLLLLHKEKHIGN